jgi:hypothetical protein
MRTNVKLSVNMKTTITVKLQSFLTSSVKWATFAALFAFFSMQAQAGSMTVVNGQEIPITIIEWNHCYRPSPGGEGGTLKEIQPGGSYKWTYWKAEDWRGCLKATGQFGFSVYPKAPGTLDPDCKKSPAQCKADVALDKVALKFAGDYADYMLPNPFPGTLSNVKGALTFTTGATSDNFKKAKSVKIIAADQVAIIDFTNQGGEYKVSNSAKVEKQKSFAKAISQGATTSVSASGSVSSGIYSASVNAESQTTSSSSTNNTASEGSENRAESEIKNILKDGQIRAVTVFGNIVEIDGKISFQLNVERDPGTVVLEVANKKFLIGYYSLVPSMRALGMVVERPFRGSSLEKIVGLFGEQPAAQQQTTQQTAPTPVPVPVAVPPVASSQLVARGFELFWDGKKVNGPEAVSFTLEQAKLSCSQNRRAGIKIECRFNGNTFYME